MPERINYYTYIRSAEWYTRRATLIQKQCIFTDRPKSWPCNNKRLELHHINYKNLGDETDKDVLTLCDRCHTDITWNGHYRRPMWEQEAYVMELLGKTRNYQNLRIVVLTIMVFLLLIIVGMMQIRL